MATFKRTERSPIGVDVGRRYLKAVQLVRAGGAWEVSAAAVVPRDTAAASTSPGGALTPAEVRLLSDTLDRQSFRGNEVALAAPDGVLSSVLELPPLPGGGGTAVEQIARIEVARTHKWAPDSFEMGCWDLPTPARAQKATHVMAVALPHGLAEPLLDAFDAEGLDVCGMDLRAVALARACAPLTDDAGITAVLDLGWGSAELSLLYRDAIIYGRSLTESGTGRLRDALAGRLRVDGEVIDYLLAEAGLGHGPRAGVAGTGDGSAGADEFPPEGRSLLAGHADAVVHDMQASFAYAVHQYPDAAVTRLLLVAGAAAVPGLAAYLGAALGIDTRVASPALLTAVPAGRLSTCGSPALTAALGLAMYLA